MKFYIILLFIVTWCSLVGFLWIVEAEIIAEIRKPKVVVIDPNNSSDWQPIIEAAALSLLEKDKEIMFLKDCRKVLEERNQELADELVKNAEAEK